MSVRVAVVAAPGADAPDAGPAGRAGQGAARLGGRLVVWGDDGDARLAGPAATEVATVGSAGELRLVTQVGDVFRHDHPDVPVLVDAGRYLVVRLAPGGPDVPVGDTTCFRVEPLVAGRVAFAPVAAPPPAAREAWVDALVAGVSTARWVEAVTHLASYPTRHSLSPALREAAAWAEARLRVAGYVTRTEGVPVGAGESLNVVAERTGRGPAPRDLVVVTAHLDSVNHPAGGGPGAVAPGADDNASGAAGVLEVAHALAAHAAHHDLRLVLFGGEEQGLHGSRHHVAAMGVGDRARTRAVVNMDMIAVRSSPGRTVLLEGAPLSERLVDALASAAAAHTTLAVQRSLHPFASDHVPFLDAGIPAVLTIEGADSANTAVHTAGDTVDRLDPALATDVLRMNVAAVAGLLGSAARRVPPPAGWALAGAPGQLDVFGVGTDAALWHRTWRPGVA